MVVCASAKLTSTLRQSPTDKITHPIIIIIIYTRIAIYYRETVVRQISVIHVRPKLRLCELASSIIYTFIYSVD